MVRLNVVNCKMQIFAVGFQFLYGAIECLVPVLFYLCSFMFQFLYGAIECHWFESNPDHKRVSIPLWCDWMLGYEDFTATLMMFQFLYGAIECYKNKLCKWLINVSIPLWCDWMTSIRSLILWAHLVSIPLWCDWMDDADDDEVCRNMFQFLYGAIEWNIGKSWKTEKKRFNSSMVRLNESDFVRDAIKEKSFNSSMVRLNVVSELLSLLFSGFQFLYGAIEWKRFTSNNALWICFNSSMVRLNV